MKGEYCRKNINDKKLLIYNHLWRGTTDGDTLYRRLFSGVKTKLLTPFLVLNGCRTRLKPSEELPSGSHCPKKTVTQINKDKMKYLVLKLNLDNKISHQLTKILPFLKIRNSQYSINGGSSFFLLGGSGNN